MCLAEEAINLDAESLSRLDGMESDYANTDIGCEREKKKEGEVQVCVSFVSDNSLSK